MIKTAHKSQNLSEMKGENVRYVCEQLKANINRMTAEARHLSDAEKFERLHRLHELQQILSTIEDIDHAVDILMEQQLQKRPTDIH